MPALKEKERTATQSFNLLTCNISEIEPVAV